MTDTQKNTIKDTLNKGFVSLQNEWNDIVLGGSLTLIIQGTIPYRTPVDVDIVGHRFNFFAGSKITHQAGSDDDTNCIVIKVNGIKYDFFLCPYLIYSEIEFQGLKLKVQNPGQIISAKLKYWNKHNITKHRDDVAAYMNVLKNGMPPDVEIPVNNDDNDLPF